MYKKVCNRCTRSSFSSTEIGDWICPSCGQNITEAPLYTPILSHSDLIPLRKKLEAYEKNMNKKYL
jgi:ribosomal protein L37AE/L43A